ncbi:MAG: arginine deiminase [Saprospiraceae bacterium]|nr:arginine deiminase [Saprospiraceae bacterium]
MLLDDLLLDILGNESVLKKLVPMVCSANLQQSLSNVLLDNFSIKEIKEILLSGLTASELFEHTGLRLGSTDNRDDIFILDPCPNAYFTRDPAAVLGHTIVSSKMSFYPRVRETLIFKEIFTHHPLFKNSKFSFGKSLEEDRPFCIEGGDIIVLNEKAIAVGCSQRTRSEAIAKLAKNLFKEGIIQRVYEVNIPAERAYMHLDTVFTIVDNGLVVAYPDVMEDVKEIRRYEPMYIHRNEVIVFPISENRTFNLILEEEFGPSRGSHTGNNNRRYASREQLADGTNVFAIAPGVVVTYDRNVHTNKALNDVGVKTLQIEGSELVRGLGGPAV